jgi:predicted deacylase
MFGHAGQNIPVPTNWSRTMTEELLGHSAGGHEIRLFKLGKDSHPKWFLIGGVHGDEPEGAQVVLDFIAKAQPRENEFKTQVICIPRYNPDGLELNQRTNGSGVDLNRNFPTPDWSAEFKAPRYFPGKKASSEPETQNLLKKITEHEPFLIIHCHTYLPQICYTGERSKPWALKLAKAFDNHPITDDIGYPTPGSLGQYCNLVLQKPVVCIELPEQIERNKAWNLIGQSLLEIAIHGA